MSKRAKLGGKCDFCPYLTHSHRLLFLHSMRKHSDSYVMTCKYGKCKYSTKSWQTYKMHVRRRHPDMHTDVGDNASVHNSSEDDVEARDIELVNTDEDINVQSNVQCRPDKLLAREALILESCNRIPKSAVSRVVCSTESVVMSVLSNLEQDIMKSVHLDAHQVDCMRNIIDQHKQANWVDQLKSDRSRQSFYRTMFVHVEPEEVFLGSTYAGDNKLKKHTAAIVPFEKLLKALLLSKEMSYFARSSHESVDEKMRDVCDGKYVRSHKLSLEKKNWLQVVLYYDDIEMQNPLRTSGNYKLGMFYVTFCNIPPEYRSSLHNIFVIGIAKAKDMKTFGVDRILGNFLACVSKLKKDGIRTDLGQIYGDLVMVVADHPAASMLGGFKESPAWAHMPCRMCKITKDNER